MTDAEPIPLINGGTDIDQLGWNLPASLSGKPIAYISHCSPPLLL